MQYLNRMVTAAVLGMLGPGLAMADEAGKVEYMNSCASCHGPTALGDGPLARLMTIPIPPLTTLAAANDGKFPMLDVIQAIDGRQRKQGHGYPMPVWGSRFHRDIGTPNHFGNEAIVRARILSLAYYLESIQE